MAAEPGNFVAPGATRTFPGRAKESFRPAFFFLREPRFNARYLMARLPRFLFAATAAIGLVSAPAAPAPAPGAPSVVPAAASQLTAAEQAELAALLGARWEHTVTLRGSVGWRDNVLLSPFAPLGRAFGRGELEAFLWRPARNQWELVSFLSGDVVRYFSPPPETSGEQQWFLHGEARWQPTGALRLALKGDAFFQDTVIDLSETEATRIVAPTRAQGAFATATPRLKLPGGFTLEPAVQAKRTDYRDFPGDYSQTGLGARLEWKRSDALRLAAAWFEHTRRYSQRGQFTAGGRALAGTHLRFRQRDGEFKLATSFTARGRWTAAAIVGRLENRDGGSGYFDYDQNRGGLEFRWEGTKWKVALDGEAKRVTYRVQTAGIGIAPPPRLTEPFDTLARIERRLDAAWLLFAEHRWEKSRSNEAEFSYRDSTVIAGVERSF